MAKKTYVIDTSALLTDADCIYSYKNNDIVVPLKVLEEIDNHKKRQDGVGLQARKIIRTFDKLRGSGNLFKGVRLGKGYGLIRMRKAETSLLPEDLGHSVADHMIISCALAEKQDNPSRKVIVVSRDINMRVICDSIGLISEDFIPTRVVQDAVKLYSGFTQHLVDDQIIDHFYESQPIFLDKEEIPLQPNQFVMLVSNSNEKKTALAKFRSYDRPLKKINKIKNLWGVTPRNKEQSFAVDLLMDPDIPVVTLIGKAGTGKTLTAVACGLEQVLSTDLYKKVIVSRPVMPLGKDLGFLPGTLEEKMAPWLAPIRDNVQFLMGDDKAAMEMYFERGKIEIEALTYIRGRSISNAFIIIDESQNLTLHEVKTILTRVGEGTKIVLTGDIEQIDNVYTDQTSNGLAFIVEKFKYHDLAGHVTLQKGERSRVATLAAKIL